MSTLPLAVYFVQALGAALASATLLAAAVKYQRASLRSWAMSWAALALFVLASAATLVVTPSLPPGHALRVTLWSVSVAGKLVQIAWLLIGLHQLVGRPGLQGARAVGLGAALTAGAVVLVVVSSAWPYDVRVLARYASTHAAGAAAFTYAAWRLTRLACGRRGIGPWLLAATFGLYGLEEVRYAIGAVLQVAADNPRPEVAWLGFVDFFLHAGTGVGAVALLLEEETERRAASTERAEQARLALTESEQRQRLMLDHIDEVVYSLVPGGAGDGGPPRVTSMSGRAREILGHDAELFTSDPSLWRSLVHPEDAPRTEEAWRRMLDSRQMVWCEYRLLIASSGEYEWFEDRVTPQFDEWGALQGVFGALRNIHERKRAEDALRRSEDQARQAQKMEAVGRLAGGIAHDFNNLLTVISGHTDLLLESLPEGDPRRPDAAAIEKAAERATALVRQLLAFSRRQILHAQVLDLRDLLADLHTLLSRLIGEDVRLTTAFDPSIGKVRADRSQIEQVVLNLVVNARDALPEGGAIVIELRDASVRDEPVLERLGAPPGKYVVFAVHDTGVGIEPEARTRLFEPFYTTKEPGKGTGLGLATVYGIVRQSGGVIDVRSEAGRGASFSIYLPRIDAGTDAPLAPPISDETDAPAHGPWVVLVVEDEDAVRRFTVAALRSRGHEVLEAQDGEAALVVAGAYEGRIDLLLTDVIMPGLRGVEVATRLLASRPVMRVAFMTGYTDSATWRAAQATGHVVLAKPFTADGLIQAVRDALDVAREP